jgi:hypothetical protein
MTKYEVPEPWPTRLRETLARTLVCSWHGHHRPRKMYGYGACDRCGH